MVEPRGRKYHRDRVAETLREEISGMIAGELADPRIDAPGRIDDGIGAPFGRRRPVAEIAVARDDDRHSRGPRSPMLLTASLVLALSLMGSAQEPASSLAEQMPSATSNSLGA